MSPYPPPKPRDYAGSLGGLIAQAVLGLVVLIAVLALAARFLAPTRGQDETLPVLASTVLTDGTVVKVVAVTVGTSHSLNVPRPTTNNWERMWGIKRSENVNAHTSDTTLMIWLTRQRSETPSMIAFDTLRRAKLEWDPNRSLWNTTIHQLVHGQFGNSQSVGTPPFSTTSTSPNDLVFTNLQFPLIADPGRPVRIRLIGDSSTELGSIELKLPSVGLPVPSPWTPSPLPITQTHGSYSATLQSIDIKEEDDGRVTLLPKVETAISGLALKPEVLSFGSVKDPLGNASDFHQCNLDRAATAWSLPVQAQFRVEPAVVPDAVWKSAPLPLPTAPTDDSPVNLSGGLRGGRVGVRLTRMCGPKCGPLDPAYCGVLAGSGNWSSSLRIFGKPVQIELEDSPSSRVLKVDGSFPFVCANPTGLGPTEVLVLTEVKDDVSRDVPFQEFHSRGITLYFIDPLPDAKSVTLGFGMNERVNFEFRFAPPPKPVN
jgi:hypothetical protein